MGRKAHAAMFRGANKLTLDIKGRMVMPTRYRERLQERCGGKLVVTVDKDQCLLVYPMPDWEEIERKLMKLPTFNERVRRLQRLMVGYATELDLDAQGRVLLPPNLREFASLTRDAVLIGQGLRFELWNEEKWNQLGGEWLASEESATDLSADLESLSL
ncbi:MAG TPA: division/cell wall cluster transcriptional repressor MraZ [Steroidobacteraceae bacterium]|jgi:MraZ protein